LLSKKRALRVRYSQFIRTNHHFKQAAVVIFFNAPELRIQL